MVILIAASVPLTMALLKYLPSLFVREPRWDTAAMREMSEHMINGFTQGIEASSHRVTKPDGEGRV